MSDVLDRFLRYVRYDTQSNETSTTFPSTGKQLILLRALTDELRAIGLADASIDEYGYVMATIPATTKKAGVPTIGFLAHVDTSPEMPGAGVAPIVHRSYDGRDLVLPDDPTAVLRLHDIPALADQMGHDIVTASGTTLLGADNKAGVAEIMTAAAFLAMTAMTALTLAAISGRPLPARARRQRPAGGRGPARRAVRPADAAPARARRDRAPGLPRRAAGLPGPAPRAAAAGRAGQGAAALAAGESEDPDLPRDALAGRARALRRARGRLARHLVHARARRRPPRAPAAGAARAGRRLAELDLCVGAAVGFAADPEPLIRARKPGLAFTLGAMGSAKTNFYNEAYRRGGCDDVAREVQALWLAGKREEAAARVPDALVLQTCMLGSEAAVRERIRRYRDAGITTLRVEPLGENAHARLETLGRALELVRSECGSAGA